METHEFLSTKELAGRIKVSVNTIDKWRREKVIPSRKIGGKRIYFWNEVLEAINSETCKKSA